MRPAREIYVRTSRPTVGGAMVEPGVEYRESDQFKSVEHELYVMCIDSDPGAHEHDPVKLATLVEKRIKDRWPDRAYFVEVHDLHGGWVQIFQPFGVPRNNPDRSKHL